MVPCPVALLGSALYPILVHRLTVYAPRFLPTLGRPRAVALRFARRDQLATGLAPVGVRPCWAHKEKIPCEARDLQRFWQPVAALFLQNPLSIQMLDLL